MQFIVSRNTLLQALQHVRCAITKQQIQVFKCFVFSFPSAGDGSPVATMTVHASNGSVWMEEKIAIEAITPVPAATTPGASAAGTRPFAIYHEDLMKPVKSLDEQPLRFEVKEYQVIVHHSVGSFRLPLYQNASEFFDFTPPAPDAEADDGYLLEYEAPCLKSVLSRCSFAMSQDELRPVMSGVYFNLTDNFCDYVSSDGHKLVRVRKAPAPAATTPGASAAGPSFIIPYPVVKALIKVLPSTGDATVQYQKELTKKETRLNHLGSKEEYLVTERRPQCRITIDDTLTISFNTVEGPYPKYWRVIPEHHNFTMTIDRKALVRSVDRLSLFSSDGLLTMNIDETTLQLSTEDPDMEVAGDETFPCECRMASGSTAAIRLRIGMKASNTSQILKALSTEKVVFSFLDQSQAVLIQPHPQPDNEEITMLIMPMLCKD